ncbi:protein C10-like [Lineus longissimus]|uniref:protein C10-like n=1 Tax=Lineus longissimus TaxID=88925 RepID=UPI002B4DD974
MATAGPNFTAEDAKAAMRDILEAFHMPENDARIQEARDNAGNDMLKMMQIVFPITTQIQMDVVQKYGFSADGEGIIQFAHAVKIFSKHDADLAQLNSELISFVIPQMDSPPAPLSQPQTSTGAQAAANS